MLESLVIGIQGAWTFKVVQYYLLNIQNSYVSYFFFFESLKYLIYINAL